MKGKYKVRSGMVARNFKGGDKDRDDLFAETAPLEAKRLLMSRAVTGGGMAHLSTKCEEDVYLEVPEECHCPPGYRGKLRFWMYGMRQAAAAWERLSAYKLSSVGLVEEFHVE
eukprot:11156597-Karenia_brevis.AAC.1